MRTALFDGHDQEKNSWVAPESLLGSLSRRMRSNERHVEIVRWDFWEVSQVPLGEP